MKWFLIVANLTAATTLFFLGNLAMAVNHAFASSVYQGLKMQHVLAENPAVDVEKSLREIADGGKASLWLVEIAAGICLANAVAIGIWLRKPTEDAHPNSS